MPQIYEEAAACGDGDSSVSPELQLWEDSWTRSNRKPAFHVPKVNLYLLRHLCSFLAQLSFSFRDNNSILVPLCGKSKDLVYLFKELQLNVVGVEFVKTAIEQFFEDEALTTPNKFQYPNNNPEFTVYELTMETSNSEVSNVNTLSLWNGDFFRFENIFSKFRSEKLLSTPPPATRTGTNMSKPFVFGYDRASLVAIMPESRYMYAKTMTTLCVAQLVITCEYEQSVMAGPPFSVPEVEVRRLYEEQYKVILVEKVSSIDSSPRWRNSGLEEMNDLVFFLLPKV